jgi:hypothetical protein
MHAKPGDRLVIKGHRTGQFDTDGEILEVHGEKGQPPYLVRWAADGREVLVFPGSDAVIEPRKQPAKKTA